jgi:hypothetical protein
VATPKSDLISVAQLADEWKCTRQNANARLVSWGVKWQGRGLVSRAEAEEKRAQLGSPRQAGNSAKRWSKPEPAVERKTSNGAGAGNGSGSGNGNGGSNGKRNGAGNGHGDEFRPDGKTKAEAERTGAWLRVAKDQLSLQREMGAVVKVEEVNATFQTIGRILSSSRENGPAQLAPLLVGKTNIVEIEAILRRERRAEDDRVASEIALKLGTLGNANGNGNRR